MKPLNIFFLVFFTSIKGENQLPDRRLTGAGSATGITGQSGGPGGFGPSNTYMERYTFPPITKNLGRRSEEEARYLPQDERGFYSSNSGHNVGYYGNGDHHHMHNHNHQHNNDERDERSNDDVTNFGRSYGSSRSTRYPQTLPPSEDVAKVKDTTDRHYRDVQPVNNFTISLATTKGNATFTTNIKRRDPNRMIYPTDSDIANVFDQPQQPSSPLGKPFSSRSPSKNCSYGLCDAIDDYPEEKILNIISRSKDLQQYFSKLALDTSDFVNNRFGDDEETLCPTVVHTKFPRSASNTNNEERILVNVGDYKQGIVFETCAKEGAACAFSDQFPNNYSTSCKQKYTIRRLMTVGKESDKAVFDNFHLPSCCVCVVKKA